MSEASVKKDKSSLSAKRRAARLMAVQAVYQLTHLGGEPAHIVAEYMTYRAGMDVDGETMVEPDPALFKDLTMEVMTRRDDLQAMVDQNRRVKDPENPGKLEPLLNAILLSGAAELTFHPSTDFPIIISDYVDIAQAFYEGKEPGLVNAVLDSIRKVVRA